MSMISLDKLPFRPYQPPPQAIIYPPGNFSLKKLETRSAQDIVISLKEITRHTQGEIPLKMICM